MAAGSFSRSFAIQIVWRIALLILSIAAGAWLWANNVAPGWSVFLSVIITGSIVRSLYRYVTDTNRRLTRFLESIRYADFAVRFAASNEKGASFEGLNREFNEVLESFRATRAEKEAGLQFMQAVIQHLSTGVLAFDASGALMVSNNAAFQLLGVYRLRSLHDLPETHSALNEFVRQLSSKGKMLYQPETGRQLSVQGVALNLQGRNVRLVTIQNIHPELQRKESDAWRNLTRVLRHEIMNSVTPIVTIAETMKDIVHNDLPPGPATADLEEALEVVAGRSRSLMEFVEAYRSFSALPQPRTEPLLVAHLLERVTALTQADLKKEGVALSVLPPPAGLALVADPGQIEMVLINLLKNAREALSGTLDPEVTVQAGAGPKGNVYISITDNGPGIAPELLDEIFIPFYTTKNTGTGVGLSISRQIMQAHGGDLRATSGSGRGAVFVMEF